MQPFKRLKTCLLLLVLTLVGSHAWEYNAGVGKADVTGPAAEIGMMGYAKQGQNTAGIHIRLYARAFVVEEVATGTRVVFVSVDAGMMGQLVKKQVMDQLELMYPGVYTEKNVVISATHTHSGPAGYMQYVIFNVSNLGFLKQSMDALVDGIVDAISRAHTLVRPAKIYVSQGKVAEANINRSPTSYDANPEEERARYPDGNTDKTMVQLTFVDLQEDEYMGVFNWFAVHPTSMNNTNHLISGDNKGLASQLFEKEMNPGVPTGRGGFVAAFASTNLGDISPNIKGPKCLDTGLPCDLEHSTCEGRTQMCVAFGPGEDMYESTRIIAERQYAVSKALLEDESGMTALTGSIKYAHQWIDMTKYEVNLADGSTASTCTPALGYSFAAGTTDGPGEFDFTQGTITGNPFWDFISGILKGTISANQYRDYISEILKDPEPETVACHAPKPILLDTGEFKYPYAWHPTQVDTQIIKIGQLYLLAVPGEFTTMAGRRLRETVEKLVQEQGEDIIPVVAGLSNTYTHYITTFEEYQKQRYEAASNIYGPRSLEAYQQQYSKLAASMLTGEELPAGTPPEYLLDVQLSFIPGVIFDHTPGSLSFGHCIQQPHDAQPGQMVTAKFVSGHLRNDLLTSDSFLRVEHNENGEWIEYANDDDWSTRLYWERTNAILGESEVTVLWDIPQDAPRGEYRIIHKGYYKHIIRGLTPYIGTSKTFLVGLTRVIEEPVEEFFEEVVESKNPFAQLWKLIM